MNIKNVIYKIIIGSHSVNHYVTQYLFQIKIYVNCFNTRHGFLDMGDPLYLSGWFLHQLRKPGKIISIV